jgi:hypothetical protein
MTVPPDDFLTRLEFAIARAKRVRRESTLVVQSLSQLRDDFVQAQEATTNGSAHRVPGQPSAGEPAELG